MCAQTIASVKFAISQTPERTKPLFGICLGNQLLAIAAGATTYKMKYGNRGANQPCIDMRTGRCYITPQNHGFAVDSKTLPEDWKTFFLNANDFSNEGVIHASKPFFSVQFHPEAAGGPMDTSFLFEMFVDLLKGKPRPQQLIDPDVYLPAQSPVRKVLLLGSGGLSIGQAGEFDYSGSQAIKALKEEGIEVVLINPNIATVQTSQGLGGGACADQVYFLPVTRESALRVIEKEKPDSILVSMGGQTALNVGVKLFENGDLAKHNVRVLGTQIPVIVATEDREMFAEKLAEIDETLALSFPAVTIDQACEAAARIGYPVLVRAAFALGGLGSGFADNEVELKDLAEKAFSVSDQILIDQDLRGWKEVEYEVVRDARDNCITVCNMENFDPLGVHTGDSIVVAPSQTLSNREYFKLRATAIKVVRHLGIVGECNIQYALHPGSLEYCIIEVNARLSRSSALASKATGYPLAFVAAKLSLGMQLTEVKNAVTKVTQACFEPSLDYVVTKIPRWDLAKFEGVSTKIGSAMKSVGEVMSIGRTWEESMQKAMRMVDPAIAGFEPRRQDTYELGDHMNQELQYPSDRRIFAIAQGLYSGTHSVKDLHDLTDIDNWFLERLHRIAVNAAELKTLSLESITRDQVLTAKQNGFSDAQLSSLLVGSPTEDEVRAKRKGMSVTPFVKQIDTLAAEYPAQTNYLYCTYHAMESDIEAGEKGGVVVLGNGAYRIGSSVEFDWCAVSAIRTLRAMGKRAVMINYNPETVSTDYDECDQLYFEELSRERVMDIYDQEGIDGVIVSVGGQIPQNLAMPLSDAGVKILGTPAEMIDGAEDRFKFSAMLDKIGVQQPAWRELADMDSALEFAERVGYPVLVRPSYVLSGAAMNVAHTPQQLRAFLSLAEDVSADKPVVVSKFIEGAREIEMDAVCRGGQVVASAVHEHIENAGVHSGDATLLLPPQDITHYTLCRIEEMTRKIAKELNITGPCNVQFITKGSNVLVIECNLRASRSFPFVSKTMGVDFIEAATKVMMGQPIDDMNLPNLGERNRPSGYVGCKAPMFSFTRLRGADPVLGVEMASTGEVACFGADKHEAFLKALLSTGFKLPKKNILLSFHESLQDEMVHSAWSLHEMGYSLMATEKTHEFLEAHDVPSTLVHFPDQPSMEPNVKSLLRDQAIDLVVNLPTYSSTQTQNNFDIRRTAVDFGIPLLTQPQLVKLFVESLERHKRGELVGMRPDSLFDYYQSEKAEETWTGPRDFH
mmetsp:Transcript_44556/g.90012  ORF Transcript_44556/g.90012 Transcript_44556/m.90012 type:complete len:1247 (-) Transcript_44556:249-3989(-)